MFGVRTGRRVEMWLTEEGQTQLDQAGATVAAIAPAELMERDGRRGLRMPVASAQGDPSR